MTNPLSDIIKYRHILIQMPNSADSPPSAIADFKDSAVTCGHSRHFAMNAIDLPTGFKVV